MSFIERLRLVAVNITENKVKVLLTMLGIIVGTLTVVIVLAVGRGSQADVEEQYKNLNVGTLQVVQAFGRNVTLKLTDELAGYLAENNTSLSQIAMVQNTRTSVTYDGIDNTLSVIGVTEEVQVINNLEIAYGRYITNEDNESKEKVAVIGMTTAETYFESDVTAAIGESIAIDGRKYEIVGILEYQGDTSMRDMNPDESVMIPYKVAAKYMTGRMARPSMMVLAKDFDSVTTAKEEVQSALEAIYDSGSDQFMIIDSGNRLVAAKASARSMTYMLLVVALMVLIVGGIGIMNVLFVSVKERTREIGILKAIGAKKRDILSIFLYEAVIISLLGSILGIAMSFMVVPVLKWFEVSVFINPLDLILAMAFSMGIGTFFGIYPAAKAAGLKPIDALNYE